MCVMMTEIQNLKGGQKSCLLTRRDQIKKEKKELGQVSLIALERKQVLLEMSH